jgi:hypothetical protein
MDASFVTIGYHRSVEMLCRSLERDSRVRAIDHIGCRRFSDAIVELESGHVDTVPATLTFSADNIRARNRIAHYALHNLPRMKHVLWWDDDQWPYDVGIVGKMLATGEDFVSAPYVTKEASPRWVHTWYPDKDPYERGLMQVHNVGFGFTITSRACLERVSASAKRYYDTSIKAKIPNIFGLVSEMAYPREATGDPEDETLLSEDLSFCSRWRAIGGKIWLYAGEGNMVGHAGGKVWDARDMGKEYVK